jgi:RNA polymerase sigma-70 factor (ECF subfamily)
MSDEPARWQSLVDGLRRGDQHAAQEFWGQFGHLLQQLADKNLAEGMRRRVGPEDVAQSACRTFLRRARLGEFQLPDSESLWRLLCAITLTKVREQTRFHLRKRRGLDREVHAAALSNAGASGAGFDRAAPGPTPAEVAEFDDQFQKLLASMDEEERQIVDLKLQDCTQEEIAERLGCSERTVRRILKRVQQRLARVFDVPSDAPEP